MSAELPLNWILEKTPKGRDELATRANHLTPGQRNLLIMADGNRRVAELLKAGADPERCLLALRGLLEEGYLVRNAAAFSPDAPVSLFATDAPQQTPHALLIALVEEQFGAQAPPGWCRKSSNTPIPRKAEPPPCKPASNSSACSSTRSKRTPSLSARRSCCLTDPSA